MRIATGIRVLALLALVAGLAVLGTGRAAAQTTTFTGTVHAMECFQGVGAAIFEECHTDIETSTEIIELEGNTAELVIPDEDLAGYLGAYVYCSEQGSGAVLFDGSYADGVAFPVAEGDDVVCDVYFITPAPDGGTDGGATDGGSTGGGTTTGGTTGGTTTSGTTALPATGTGPAPLGGSAALLLAVLAAGVAGFGLTLRRAPR